MKLLLNKNFDLRGIKFEIVNIKYPKMVKNLEN